MKTISMFLWALFGMVTGVAAVHLAMDIKIWFYKWRIKRIKKKKKNAIWLVPGEKVTITAMENLISFDGEVFHQVLCSDEILIQIITALSDKGYEVMAYFDDNTPIK